MGSLDPFEKEDTAHHLEEGDVPFFFFFFLLCMNMQSCHLGIEPMAAMLTGVGVLPDTVPSHQCLQVIMITHLYCSFWTHSTVLNRLITSTCGTNYYWTDTCSLTNFLKCYLGEYRCLWLTVWLYVQHADLNAETSQLATVLQVGLWAWVHTVK